MAAVSVKRPVAHFLSTYRCILFFLTLSIPILSLHYSFVILQQGIERYYRDLTEIQCAIREDDKFLDRMWNFVNLNCEMVDPCIALD